ncbi:MAG TPA: hypothetical protein VKD72_22380 [Gemmataceae bacterium]|nr:hypothetical protein [Gemmataceae bacterium]
MENQPVLLILLIVVAVGISVAAMVWRYQRADQMLRDWAGREGYQLLSASQCWFWRGPYWFRTTKSQMVYRVTVRDQYGEVRSGYARLGGWFLGMWSDEVDVTWD